jgi:sulfur-carrier protein
VPVTVQFAPALQRHVACADQQVDAATAHQALIAAFAAAPALRHYVLDEQSRLRKHVAVFCNGVMLDRTLASPVNGGDCILVIQALSGG